MLVFFGTSSRSAIFLEKALLNGLKVKLVVSEPAKPIGRKQIITENPTVGLAKKLQIPYLQKMEDILKYHSPTLGLILDFNKIIPKKIIDRFKKGIINIHFSRLPAYRGPSPIQYTILNGGRKAWITYYLISERVDEGQILVQNSFPLDLTETTDSLYLTLIDKTSLEAPEIISAYLGGKILPQAQIGPATLTQRLTSGNCRIDWSKSSKEIERLIRAAYSEPGAWTQVELKAKSEKTKVKRLKILKAHLEERGLILDQVQLEGKNPVSWKQFQQGHPEAKII
jgi:methionyl-tRNA formyltransferase